MEKFQPNNQNILSKKTIFLILFISLLAIILSASCYFAYSFYKAKINLKKSDILLQNQPKKTTAENSQLQTGIIPLNKQKIEPSVHINDDIVYYTDENNKTIAVASSIRDSKKPNGTIEPEKNKEYKQAKLSPNKKYIALLYQGWEWLGLEIYDINIDETHQADNADDDFIWLSDNRIQINGSCGMGIACGIWESASKETPWKLKRRETDIIINNGKSIIYNNNEYFFTLKLPLTWKDAVIKTTTVDSPELGKSDVINFGFTETDLLFTMNVFTKDQWGQLDEPKPNYINENGVYVFSYSLRQTTVSEELKKRREEAGVIIPSFKFGLEIE